MKTQVCYLLSNGFSARMVLHSDLVDRISDLEIRTTILAPEGSDQALAKFESESLKIACSAFPKNRLQMALTDARRYLREPIRDNAALWSRHLFQSEGMAGTYAKYRARFNYVAHRALFRRKSIHRIFDSIDRAQHRSNTIRASLEQLKPDLVVSTYPVTSFEVAGLLEAKSLGIPTVGHLLSWDNITCKGRFPAVPDYFISWGPIMTSELQEHYQIPLERIHECGVPHFDAHKRLVDTVCLRTTLAELELNANSPFMFFGMSAPIFAPHEIDVVEWLARQVEQNRFGDDMQLIIRPHPQNVQGNMADESWLPRLNSLGSKRVGLNLPRLTTGTLDWDMEVDDLKILVNLLSGCAISFNSGSTLSIDALAHDKPVIVTMFDADKTDLPWWKSARRIREYPHYKKLLALGGVSPVASFDELEREIHTFLDDPKRREAERCFTLERQCHAIDGNCSRRVAERLQRILTETSISSFSPDHAV